MTICKVNFAIRREGAGNADASVPPQALAIAFPAAMLLLMALALLERAIALSPQDWSYRHVWFFLPLFYFVGLGIARRRYR